MYIAKLTDAYISQRSLAHKSAYPTLPQQMAYNDNSKIKQSQNTQQKALAITMLLG